MDKIIWKKIKENSVYSVHSLAAASLAPYVRGGWQGGPTLAGLSSGSGRLFRCLDIIPETLCLCLPSRSPEQCRRADAFVTLCLSSYMFS